MLLALGELGLCQFDESRKIGLFAHGKISQHLAVDDHTGLLQTIHETGVGKTVQPGTGIDTQNPQATQFALAQLAAMESIGERTLNSFTGDTIQTTATAAEPLGHIQIFLVPTMGSKTSLYTHGNPPFLLSDEAEIRPAGHCTSL